MKFTRTLGSTMLALAMSGASLCAQMPLQQPVASPAALPAVTTPPASPVEVAQTFQSAVVVPSAADGPVAISGLVGGASFYYLKPFISNNTALMTTIPPSGTQLTTSQVTSDTFHWRYQPASAYWIGWTTPSGLGIRSRWFRFEQSSETENLVNGETAGPVPLINPPLANILPFLSTGGQIIGSPGAVLSSGIGSDQIAVTSSLKINTVDLEATYAWDWAWCSLLASGGLRYLSLDQHYSYFQLNNGGGLPVTEAQALNVNRTFSGVGPVVGLQGNLRLGQSGLALYAAGRTSLLVGTATDHYTYTSALLDPTGLVLPAPGTQFFNFQGSRTSDHTIPVAELELGLQYARLLGTQQVFCRTAGVSQTYFDAGNSTQAGGNLTLFGLQVSLGINY